MTAIHDATSATADQPIPAAPDAAPAPTDAFADRVFHALLGALEVQAAYLGDRLGWYRALTTHGPMNAAELATRTGTDARYAREWLEHQTVSGYLAVVDAAADPDVRRFYVPADHVPVLGDELSTSYMLPFARMTGAFGKSLDDLVEAYRTGGGLSWAHHGADARESQADANRPMFLRQLAQEFLASIAEVDAALVAGGRVADVGCGFGWSSIGVALGYPDAHVDGFDVDAPSIERAREAAAAEGVTGRVGFHAVDVAAIDRAELARFGTYDLVMALECIHDLPDPVGVLATMRAMAGPSGTVIVMDERVGHAFTGEADPVEQLMYGFSIVGCLPDGRAHTPSAATGTVMRPPTLERYAVEGGFTGIEELPIEHDFFRFYRLRTP